MNMSIFEPLQCDNRQVKPCGLLKLVAVLIFGLLFTMQVQADFYSYVLGELEIGPATTSDRLCNTVYTLYDPPWDSDNSLFLTPYSSPIARRVSLAVSGGTESVALTRSVISNLVEYAVHFSGSMPYNPNPCPGDGVYGLFDFSEDVVAQYLSDSPTDAPPSSITFSWVWQIQGSYSNPLAPYDEFLASSFESFLGKKPDLRGASGIYSVLWTNSWSVPLETMFKLTRSCSLNGGALEGYDFWARPVGFTDIVDQSGKPVPPEKIRFVCVSSGGSTVGNVALPTANQVISAPLAYAFTNFVGQPGLAGTVDQIGSSALFDYPECAAFDAADNLYVSDSHNHTIREVSPAGVVTTIAGVAGVPGWRDGMGNATLFNTPAGIAVDNAGNIYVAEWGNHAIRKLTPSGTSWAVTTLAGSIGVPGSADGVGTAAQFYNPAGVAVDNSGNVYVADYVNSTIRMVSPAGLVTTIAGSAMVPGSVDGPGATARFSQPVGVAVDNAGSLFVADTYNQEIRKLTLSPTGWVVSTVAGSAGLAGSADGIGSSARFYYPTGLGIDSAGNLYVADQFNDIVRQVTPGGAVVTVGGTAGFCGSADGVGNAAGFCEPYGLAVDGLGDLFVLDSSNDRISKGTPLRVSTVTVVNPILDQSAVYGAPFSYTLPAGTFTDSDSSRTLNYTASNMPPGISFDPVTRLFSGTATSLGVYTVVVAATDNGSPPASASTSFSFTVTAPLPVATTDSISTTHGNGLTFSGSGLLDNDSPGASGLDLSLAGVSATSSQGGTITVADAPLWVSRFNGAANGGDSALAVAADAGGNIYVAGYSRAQTGDQLVTIKYDRNGVGIWTNASSSPAGLGDYPAAIVLDNAAGVLVVGRSYNGNDYDFITLKLDAGSGLGIWTNYFGGSAQGADDAGGVAVDSAANVYVSGTSWSGTSYNYVLVKYAANGAPLWTNRLAGLSNNGQNPRHPLAVDGLGGVYLTGYGPQGIQTAFMTIRFDPITGSAVWTNWYTGGHGSSGFANAVTVDNSGGVYVTGYAGGGSTDWLATLKYDSQGNVIWTNVFGPVNASSFESEIALDAAGAVIISSLYYNGSNMDFATVKMDAQGRGVWTNTLGRTATGDDWVTGMGVDALGNVFVTGRSWSGAGPSGTSDFLTVKYSPNGALLWTQVLDGANANQAGAAALVMDSDGNAIVTGFSAKSGSNSDYETVKYGPQIDYTPPPGYSGSDSFNYTIVNRLGAEATGTVTVVIAKATPVVTWAQPGDITYPMPLQNQPTPGFPFVQLNATANVPGTFAYNPPAGTVLSTGRGQVLRATFTPSDSNYNSVILSNTITVDPGFPNITWLDPADIVYGTPLGTAQLNATAKGNVFGNTVAGTFAYSPAAGTILSAGAVQPLRVDFMPSDTNYLSNGTFAHINVLKAAPIVSWPQPSPVLAGMALGSAQLNASASVPGTFTYTPAAGTILNVGTGQILQAVFTPLDTLNYLSASASVSIDVLTISWMNVGDITTTTASGQCSAAVNFNVGATEGGSALQVVCNPPSGSIFPLGTTPVTCSTTDPWGNSASTSFNVTVNPSTPVLASLNPSSVTTSTALTVQVNGCGFGGGTTLLWNGSPRPTTLVNSGELTVAISSSDLALAPDQNLSTVIVMVQNADGSVSGPLPFTIINPSTTLGTVESQAIPAGQSGTVITTASAGQTPAVTAAINNSSGTQPIAVSTGVYSSNPVSGPSFAAGTTYTDLQVSGAPANSSMVVTFFSVQTDPSLVYFNGTTWAPVLSDSAPPNPATAPTATPVSGGATFTVVFDAASTPPITQLTGTVIAMARKLDQSIAFTVPTTQVLGSQLNLGATASSGQPVTFNITPNSPATMIGNRLTLTGVGAVTITASQAGNTYYKPASVSQTILVQYSPAGVSCSGTSGHTILQPINSDGSSVFKQGSTVPAKFMVFDANCNSVGTPGVVTNFKLIKTTGGVVSGVNETVSSSTPDTAFRWDSTAKQWVFNISTKSLSSSTTYYYEIDLNDGTSILFQFGLK
jgi:hypothetical protein